jgi:hypothetical protein
MNLKGSLIFLRQGIDAIQAMAERDKLPVAFVVPPFTL